MNLSKIKYYLINEADRISILDNGFSEAISNHTYTNRSDQFANIFNCYICAQKKPPYNSIFLTVFIFYEFFNRIIKKIFS